ncbi:BspA family leucine-rich repeat surface protein [Flagellimonas algicola]|uniref:BspA family leucine-rich repeat surface protein n=1 Tax=Flagellimonas algicola TaxID=2583815 RepID=A0ABY2WJL5_9FLAO|nr:BspA family leucine-rich repeat surface protein [Allomuricauda algicola]TMU55031.1 BspA family leucine-rich repeat surface protein [Allomuricauda algicola]
MMKRIAQWPTVALALVLIVIACGKEDGPSTNPEPGNGTPNIAAQTLNASEDIAPGVIDNVSASDPDGDPITFSIKTNSDNLFKISEEGELSLAADKKLDYESASSHELIVEVSDGTNSASETITVLVGNVPDEPFITTWKVGDGETLEIPTGGDYTYSCTINWGDGTEETITSNTPSHTYGTAGTYTVTIGIGFPSIEMKDSYFDSNLVSIEQWGEIEWKKLENAFNYCVNMIGNATDAPDLSLVTSLEGMFASATSFTGNLNNWDVGNVVNMASMFDYATSFNSNLNNWNVTNVTNMADMFNGAESFNGDIGNWDVRNVENMRAMFLGTKLFNQDLSAWKVDKVANMAFMFSLTTAFNGNINTWDVSNVETMESMFRYAKVFNQDLSKWKTGKVTNLHSMFFNASNFDSDLSNWKVDLVTDMSVMFSGATSFNSDISNWKVGKVTDMWGMFRDAESFDQDLGGWDISKVENMAQMLDRSGLSSSNYSKTLIGWANQLNVPNGITLGAEGLEYCTEVSTYRDVLDIDNEWTINDDTQVNCS